MNKIDTLVRDTFIEACKTSHIYKPLKETLILLYKHNRKIEYDPYSKVICLFFYDQLVAEYDVVSNELYATTANSPLSPSTLRVINSVLPEGIRCRLRKGEVYFNKTKSESLTIKFYLLKAS